MVPATRRRALRSAPRNTRTKPAISYAESSSGTESEPDDGDIESVAGVNDRPSRRTYPRITTVPRRPSKRPRPSSSQSHKSDHRAVKRPRQTRPRSSKSPRAATETVTNCIQFSGIVPAWQTLPYHILVQIFRYASYPLYDEHTFQPLPSGRWLLHVARQCRSFAEPAFTVLYESPPLVPMVVAHRLVDLLTSDPLSLAFKYRQKVESLRIDVGQVAAYSLPGNGHLNLNGLIRNLPRLTALEFYHQLDMSPYRNLDDSIKWTYPPSIFEALEYVDPAADALRGDKSTCCKLSSWRWSSRLAGKRYPIEVIPGIHLKPSFASLKKVAFVNYQVPYIKKDGHDPKHEEILAGALKNLRNLEHLIFESSTLVNAKLLPMLPTNLRHLELVNCWEIIGADFSAFLLTHGSQLRCLTLNHNQSLNLSFLPILGTACSKLQVLRMNLTYYNVHATYRDSQPQYEQLLSSGEIPVWPSSLQVIELIQMRKWEIEAAEMFFQSLLDSAGTLPDLRKLVIQAIINIAWRDRASFRDKWVGSLARVFKRMSADPQVLTTCRKPTELPISVLQVVIPDRDHQEKQEVNPSRKSLRSSLGSSGETSSSSLSTVSRKILKARDQPTNNEQSSPPARRSTRTSIQDLRVGRYAESPDNSEGEPDDYEEPAPEPSTRTSGLARELEILRDTAGTDSPHLESPPSTPGETYDDDSENEAAENIIRKYHGKGKGKAREQEFIQGMCEVVEVRIDNLRPTETQVTEADFLDEEAPDDHDWDGDVDGDEQYAW